MDFWRTRLRAAPLLQKVSLSQSEQYQSFHKGKLFVKTYSFFLAVIAAALAGCLSRQGLQTRLQSAHTEICKETTEQEIAALFDRWNHSLQTGNPHDVVTNYAERSILLPTLSSKPRLTRAEKEDYFHHFLKNRPSGRIDMRFIEIGCNTAVDAGLYTFTFASTGEEISGRYSFTYRWNGSEWLITSHHSSAMPEKE